MLAKDSTSRRGSCLFLGLTFGIASLMAGCGAGGGDKPAPVSEEQQKKNQALISGGYREQIMEHAAKLKAAAKQKATAKQGP